MARRKNDNADKIDGLVKSLEKKEDEIGRVIATTVLEHFEDSFQNQGFTDRRLDPWEERKKTSKWTTQKEEAKGNKSPGSRNILVDSGNLQNSLQIVSHQLGKIEVGSVGVPYARIHNEGGTIQVPITPKMRGYMWHRYRETGIPFFRNMATTKKSKLTIEIPKRQFIGESQQMEKKINKAVSTYINRLIKRK